MDEELGRLRREHKRLPMERDVARAMQDWVARLMRELGIAGKGGPNGGKAAVGTMAAARKAAKAR